jgi:hypothetical protein
MARSARCVEWLAPLAASNGSLRSLRCSLEAAVFVGSDETIVSEDQLLLDAFRRLVLQIGGANIASADRAMEPAYFVVARRRKSVSAPSSSARRRRDPTNDSD